jgi:hypothetical protein
MLDMSDLASGDGWRMYYEEGGKYDGVLTLELHTIYGKINTRFISKQWQDMAASIQQVYGNLKAQGPIDQEAQA